jgi:hypothetical protein
VSFNSSIVNALDDSLGLKNRHYKSSDGFVVIFLNGS